MGTPDFGAGDLTRRLQDEQRQTQQSIEQMASVRGSQQRERDRQSTRGLELTAQLLQQQELLVEAQQAILAHQLQQAAAAGRDRRIQYAVLVVAIFALVAAVTIPVAIETDSWVAALLCGVATFMTGSLIACLIVWGRQIDPAD